MRRIEEERPKPVNMLPWEKDERYKIVSNIAVGDKVWMGDSNWPCKGGIKPVVKITASQIVVQFTDKYEERFRRADGYRIGGGSFSNHIMGVATAAEIKTFDAKTKAENARRKRKEDERTAAEDKRKELGALFTREHVWVGTNEFTNDQRTFKVSLEGLTEKSVRELARILNKEFVG